MPDRENEKVATLRNILARDGPLGGLGCLYSLTPHRFAGVVLADIAPHLLEGLQRAGR